MWRRYGDAAYTLMTLAIFGFETIALGALSLSFLLGSASGIASTPVEGILLGIVISTASALALLGLYLLSYHFISNMRDRWQADQLDTWTEWWIGLALTGSDEPAAGSDRRRLPRVAVHSVLSLLEVVKGEEGDRLKEALASHGVDSWFLRRARSGHLTAKLDAIENLGKARLPQAFDELLGLFHHAKPVVRRMSARAAGVTLAVMPPEDGPDSPQARFIRAIKHADLQSGVIQESLLLLETRAGRSSSRCWPTPTCPTPCAGSPSRPSGVSAWPTWPTRSPSPATTPTPSCGRPPSAACAAWDRSPSRRGDPAGRRRRRGRLRPCPGRPRGRLPHRRGRAAQARAPSGGRLLVGPPGRRGVAGAPWGDRRGHRQAGRRGPSRQGRP